MRNAFTLLTMLALVTLVDFEHYNMHVSAHESEGFMFERLTIAIGLTRLTGDAKSCVCLTLREMMRLADHEREYLDSDRYLRDLEETRRAGIMSACMQLSSALQRQLLRCLGRIQT